MCVKPVSTVTDTILTDTNDCRDYYVGARSTGR